jgi:hypothetical protein
MIKRGGVMWLLKITSVSILSIVLLLSCGKSSEESNDAIEIDKQLSEKAASEKFVPGSVDDLMSKNIINFLTQSYLKNDLQFLTENDRKFQFYKIDLNNDGKEEYFIRFMSSYFCGTGGCTFLLLDRYSELITKFTVMDTPIYVSKDVVNSWSKLIVQSGGKFKELVFDGKSYPSNPSIAVESKSTPGSDFEVIFDDLNFPCKTYKY